MGSYCGKNCSVCNRKDELNCHGCKEWSTSCSAECNIAQCCKSKNHDTCVTCNISFCNKILQKDAVPDLILNNRKREREDKEKLKINASVVGKSMNVMFWLIIPTTISSVMTTDGIFSSNVIKTIGLCINLVSIIIYSIMLLKASRADADYRIAAYCTLAGGAAAVITGLLEISTQIGNYSLLIALPASIASFVGMYYEYNAHAEAIYKINRELSDNWKKLWKLTIIGFAGAIGGIVLILIMPIIGLLVVLASSIIVIIVGIKKLIYLYKSAKILNSY